MTPSHPPLRVGSAVLRASFLYLQEEIADKVIEMLTAQ